jgi:hypothetical protein
MDRTVDRSRTIGFVIVRRSGAQADRRVEVLIENPVVMVI